MSLLNLVQKNRIQQYNWLQPNNLLDQWNECIDSTQKRMNIDRDNIVVIASQAELLHFTKQLQSISINIASLLLDHLSISEVRKMCLAPGTAKKTSILSSWPEKRFSCLSESSDHNVWPSLTCARILQTVRLSSNNDQRIAMVHLGSFGSFQFSSDSNFAFLKKKKKKKVAFGGEFLAFVHDDTS